MFSESILSIGRCLYDSRSKRAWSRSGLLIGLRRGADAPGDRGVGQALGTGIVPPISLDSSLAHRHPLVHE